LSARSSRLTWLIIGTSRTPVVDFVSIAPRTQVPAALDPDHARVEVDVTPAKCEKLATA
jgi:hypothetical protein